MTRQGKGGQISPTSVAATRRQLQPKETPPHIRRCQDCEAELPPQGRGRPRLYCASCAYRRKSDRDAAYYASKRPGPPSEEAIAEYRRRLRESHAAAVRRSEMRR